MAGSRPAGSVAELSLREALTERLRDVIVQRTNAGGTGKRGSLGSHLAKLGRASFDFIDSVLRRRSADQIIAALVDGRISHAEAARGMRALVACGKARDAWVRLVLPGVDAQRPAKRGGARSI